MSSLSKIVITGLVTRNPEKRFTGNDLAITSFSVNFSNEDNDEKLLRVIAIGKLAETTAETVKKGQNVVVEGRLQTNTIKTESGTDKKIMEISAQGIEILGSSLPQPSSSVPTANNDFELTEEVNNDLIGEDEIPF